MKFLIVALALCATAYAALPSSEYLPPLEEAAPAESTLDLQSLETSPLADDGYRYKTVKRFRLRHRRDVNELPSNEYLPPVADAQPVVDIPVAQVAEVAQDSAVLADDGYRYKTVKRIRYRHRRDVNELPSSEYLPPAQESVAVEQVAVEAPVEVAQETAVLADDGYRYKTVKRFRVRRRRDVNELPSSEYLPPVQESAVEQVVVEAPVEVAQDSAVLADDGYRYKTVKRFRVRRRRDVNELPSSEYLPPAQESVAVEQVAVEAPVEVAQDSAVLADDGYRYKTVKRFRVRRRRDVNELPSSEYLPPAQESVAVEQVAVEAPVEVAQDSAVLADDGYRYKTVKRFRIRRRRDVNELPSSEYLPPVQESAVEQVVVEAPVAEVAQDSAVLADDGYRYKTVKRFRIRRRRDVNELPSSEYLPPAQESVAVEQYSVEAPVAEVAQDSAVLADDGYRYKTVKRFRVRRRRDVNELPSSEYLPPAQESVAVEQVAVEAPVEVAQDSAVLADDGYRYKTVKRFRVRRRRDVNELPSSEYLPPAQESVAVEQVAVEAPVEVAQDSAVLADDGYRYKTVKRFRIRRRRDVNELPSAEYLPPAQESVAVEQVAAPVVADIPQESAVRAEDGYRYKTVKRVVYRHRL